MNEKYIQFFEGLKKNNTREWFQQNKESYQNEVKKPFLSLLETLITELKKTDPEICMKANECLFRINRDLRFSKDKTPYHTLLKAGISPGGRRSELPGFYLGIGAHTVHVGGGLMNVNSSALKRVRALIAEDLDIFLSIVNDPCFISAFETVKGEKAKRLDKSLRQIAEETPYIANKQFYVMQQLPLSDYLYGDKLINRVLKSFQTILPFNQFLRKAF